MNNKNEQGKKVYRSLTEIEKAFFPISYEKKLAEERIKAPATFGTGLVTELLDSIREALAKYDKREYV